MATGSDDRAPLLSAKRAVRSDLAQRALEIGKLVIIESRDEEFRDAARVTRRSLGQTGYSGLCQRDHDDTCVNLARKDKGVAPTAQLLKPESVPVRHEGDATVRVLVGEGSPLELGTPGLILDVELPRGGSFSTAVPSKFNGFVYVLDGETTLGPDRRRARPPQIAVLGPGRLVTVVDAEPRTRFLLMAGKAVR
jgi:hypothetical protein